MALSGRIDPPGDQDVFRLAVRKGDKRVLRVESRALGRPLDPTLRVLDQAGKVLAESDDTGRNERDLERTLTAPADGEYRLVVRDLNGRGGQRFAYLLTVMEPRPDFSLSLESDRFDLTPGKPTKVTVAIQRKDSLVEPIEVAAEDLPAGVTAERVTSKPGEASARSVVLELSADDHSSPGPVSASRRPHDLARPSRLARGDGADRRFRCPKTDQPWLTIRRAGPGNPK